ncbi:hypothetical protein FDECE_13985 [Fusarium decemcellulare]|nr:hypothetical protein FDECE_13985 [Fusarium decemcellulare]
MASSRIVKVAVTQAEPVWLDLAGSVKKTCKLVTEAASNGAELIAFPECWIPGYPCWIWTRLLDPELNVRYIKNSLSLNSPELAEIQACAKTNNIAISLGFSENDNNSLFISQLLIGPDGEIKVHRRKMKPTHMERTIFGDSSAHCLKSVGQLPFARVGALSCWEHTQPLLKYNTLAQKEEIHVSAWPSLTPHLGGQDLWSMSAEGCHALSQVYAIESGTFVLHSTALVTEEGVKTLGTAGGMLMNSPGGGTSAIFGPDGRRISEPVDDTVETIIYADLNLDQIIQVRMFADCTGHYSRPDLLWLGVDKTLKCVIRQSGKSTDEVVAADEIIDLVDRT